MKFFKPSEVSLLGTNSVDFQSGQLVLVDKPKDWTSFDVVNKIRNVLRKRLALKKLKVGHSGTLDPMATGLLLIAIGKCTRLLQDFQGMDKVYTGSFTLGATTPSYDAESEIDQQFSWEHIDAELLEVSRIKLTGKIQQVPPMFSAIKVNGQPLYKLARKGKEIEVEPRMVEIYRFELTEVNLPEVSFEVHCSKGTYIRSLAHDFGKSCGSGAYLTRLCRTAIGPYQLLDAWNLDELVAALSVEKP